MSYRLISILLLLLLLLLLFKQCRARAASNLPPGPRRIPIIGNLHQLIGSMPHHVFHKLSLKHGPLMFLKLGSIPALVVSSSDVAREVFKSHDIAFSDRPSFHAVEKVTYGFLDMAFAPYGEHWRQARKVCVLELLGHRRVRSFRAVREEEVALLVASIKRLRPPPPPDSVTINLSEMLFALSNNIVCRATFGDKYGGGGGYDEGRSRFQGMLEDMQELFGSFIVADFFPWLRWTEGFTGLRKRLEKNFEEMDGLLDEVIEQHLISNEKGRRGHDVEDLVDVLLRLRKDPCYGKIFGGMNPIKGLLVDMFIGGTDTSTATTVWTMTRLMRNPRVMRKVQDELLAAVGNKSKVEESDIERLGYLRLVIKEAMRLHPAGPLLLPRETRETCTVKGYTIPARTRVFINAQAIATDPGRWKNPQEFWPERFLDDDVDFRGHDFDLIPFGFGRRVCPGISFAMLQVELTLANLLHCFDWGLPAGMKAEDLDLEEANGFTVHKKNPLCLVARTK